MTTLDRKLNNLFGDMALIRSYFISQSGKDSEGNYNPKLVKTLLSRINNKSTHKYNSKKEFSKLIGLEL